MPARRNFDGKLFSLYLGHFGISRFLPVSSLATHETRTSRAETASPKTILSSASEGTIESCSSSATSGTAISITDTGSAPKYFNSCENYFGPQPLVEVGGFICAACELSLLGHVLTSLCLCTRRGSSLDRGGTERPVGACHHAIDDRSCFRSAFGLALSV